jgi:transposase InsO family protein
VAIQRVLADGGHEFKGTFDEICVARGIRHTCTKPRHAWTNGFVERLQQTIPHEHWRVAFGRAYFTGQAALHRTLQRFMRFYNFERPHHGYRLRGHTPASIVVFGAQAVAR